MIGAYTKATFVWPGWRRTLPGGPLDGQASPGYVASTIDPRAWRATAPNAPAHGSNSPWDDTWGGTALDEGETVSDYVFRSSSETRPRPNASGGTNTIFSLQTRRSPGYAEAPGNYKALGAVVSLCPEYDCSPIIGRGPAPCYSPICGDNTVSLPGATSTVAQPPPATPGPINVTPWTVPPVSPSPSPTVAATPTPAADPITDWLSQSTVIPGVENIWIAGAALLGGFLLWHGGVK